VRAVPASSEATVKLPEGVALHARPAGAFVKTALGFGAKVSVASNGKQADAKSILAVLALGAGGGSELRLVADGDDAAEAVDALARLVRNLSE
jgi:phosphotransferase system HPr (HPr) family protein